MTARKDMEQRAQNSLRQKGSLESLISKPNCP